MGGEGRHAERFFVPWTLGDLLKTRSAAARRPGPGPGRVGGHHPEDRRTGLSSVPSSSSNPCGDPERAVDREISARTLECPGSRSAFRYGICNRGKAMDLPWSSAGCLGRAVTPRPGAVVPKVRIPLGTPIVRARRRHRVRTATRTKGRCPLAPLPSQRCSRSTWPDAVPLDVAVARRAGTIPAGLPCRSSERP
jgi:hypothetical protein